VKPNKKEIIEEIERLIDHYSPYRPITDSPEAKEVRDVLGSLLNFIEENRK